MATLQRLAQSLGRAFCGLHKGHRRRPLKLRSLGFEICEQRQLLSVTVQINDPGTTQLLAATAHPGDAVEAMVLVPSGGNPGSASLDSAKLTISYDASRLSLGSSDVTYEPSGAVGAADTTTTPGVATIGLFLMQPAALPIWLS